MNQDYIAILILTLLSGMTTLIGVSLALICKKNTKAIVTGMGFAAGIMILISLVELLPESIKETGYTTGIISFILGIVLIAILNIIIPHLHFFQEKSKFQNHLYKVAYLVAIGLVLHDFPEGFAMANSYITSANLGILIAVAIALHNIPEEFAIAAPIVLLKDRKFLYKVAFLSGLAEPAGAIIGLLGIMVFPGLVGFFLGFAGGAMLYISIHELVPTTIAYKQNKYLALGGFLSILVFIGLHFMFEV